ncbi:MAG: MerR family transcriptional regulator [Alphaproteobacteria bacterium]|nr:MerR family transcriptional regulator [Alphaproteobacteria bacterium]
MVVNKSKAAFRTIAEVADMLGVGTHVLRFWETKFTQIKPLKMNGGRRYYRPDDVKLLECIQKLLHNERYTIEGVQKLFKDKGIKNFVGNTILDDLFAEELSSEETMAEDNNLSSLSNDMLKNVIEELSSIKSELQKVI